jgi:hypothetical protein
VAKKSRRERKRSQQRDVINPNQTTPTQPELTRQEQPTEVTDDVSSGVVDEASELTIANESAENVLAREDEAMRRQATNPFGSAGAGPTAIGGGGSGPTELEVSRALRRVKRKGDTQPNRPTRLSAAPPLPPDSAAIPLAQVPYVMSDLRRVAFSAVIIAIFIVVSGLIVTNLVH